MSENFITAQQIVDLTGKSKSFAYVLIRTLNKELEDKGYITFKGRVSKEYFEERVYGINLMKKGAS